MAMQIHSKYSAIPIGTIHHIGEASREQGCDYVYRRCVYANNGRIGQSLSARVVAKIVRQAISEVEILVHVIS